MGVCVFLISACSNKNSTSVNTIKVGEVYQFASSDDTTVYFEVRDDNSYVEMRNNAQYKTQEELDEKQYDNEDTSIVPQIDYVTGTYTKDSNYIYMTPKALTHVQFNNVADVSKK